MKVSEAKTKVCPFIQNGALLISNIAINDEVEFIKLRTQNNPSNINCICGDCMAWEYTKEYEVQAFRDDEHDIDLSNGSKPKFGRELSESEREGYCKRLGK